MPDEEIITIFKEKNDTLEEAIGEAWNETENKLGSPVPDKNITNLAPSIAQIEKGGGSSDSALYLREFITEDWD